MANAIKIPDSAWHEQVVTLSGNSYRITQKFNFRDDSWYVDIENLSTEEGLYGLKLMPQQNITKQFRYGDIVVGGDLVCARIKKDFSSVGRDNLGIGKVYELWWIPDEEQEELGIDGFIQL